MVSDRGRWLLDAAPAKRRKLLRKLETAEQRRLRSSWHYWARPEQLPPPDDWRLWLVCAGRGFGKTRMGAEWVGQVARFDRHARIALVGSSIGEVRSVMVGGESGILACSPAGDRPRFEASLRRLVWPGGAQATLYSAGEPDSMRGPQHSHACRPGSEGDFRERGLFSCRHTLASCGGEPDRHASGCARRRHLLAGWGKPFWRMGRACRIDRCVQCRRMDLHSATQRDEPAGRSYGTVSSLSQWLAGSGTSSGACRRIGHRRGSKDRNQRHLHGTGCSRHPATTLSVGRRRVDGIFRQPGFRETLPAQAATIAQPAG